MSPQELISTAAERGIHLFLEGDQLRYRGPTSAVADFLPAIRAAKAGVVLALSEAKLRAVLAPACEGVLFPDGSPFSAEWFAAQLVDPSEVEDIVEGRYSREELNAFARCFACSPWPLIPPASSSPKTRRGTGN